MEGILDYIQQELTTLGAIVATIAFILLALLLMFKFKNREGIREMFSSVAIILAACVLLGGAAAFAGVFIDFGEAIPGAL